MELLEQVHLILQQEQGNTPTLNRKKPLIHQVWLFTLFLNAK